mmetsp:Transcript_6322/g.15682  ORF Transcript_6322/g.15682 Transcript_6322/m.15682 type:complete len:251 (-) Transcript_6322:1106-1858(-)
MLHPTKAFGEWPGKPVPLHSNGLNIAQLGKTLGKSSLDVLSVQIDHSNVAQIVAGNPSPLALVPRTKPPMRWEGFKFQRINAGYLQELARFCLVVGRVEALLVARPPIAHLMGIEVKGSHQKSLNEIEVGGLDLGRIVVNDPFLGQVFRRGWVVEFLRSNFQFELFHVIHGASRTRRSIGGDSLVVQLLLLENSQDPDRTGGHNDEQNATQEPIHAEALVPVYGKLDSIRIVFDSGRNEYILLVNRNSDR